MGRLIAIESASVKEKKIGFYRRVSNTVLTKKERTIAQYLLDNISQSGFMSASGIARQLHVSDVTVIRFARKLGYSGFSELRETLQSDMVDQLKRGTADIAVPSKRLSTSMRESGGEGGIFPLALQKMRDNLETLSDKNPEAVFEAVASAIYKSKRIYIMGLRGAAPLADSLAVRVNYLVDNVYRVTRADPNEYACLFHMGKDDCFIVYGYELYPKLAVSMFERAKRQGVTVISMTDKETSPLAFQTDISVYCSVEGIGFNSFASVMLANEIILAYLVKLIGDSKSSRSEELLAHLDETGFFWN